MALGLLISLGVAKVVTVVTLAKVAKRKKQTQGPKGKHNEQHHKVAEKPR